MQRFAMCRMERIGMAAAKMQNSAWHDHIMAKVRCMPKLEGPTRKPIDRSSNSNEWRQHDVNLRAWIKTIRTVD
jgi:hypothetical protein